MDDLDRHVALPHDRGRGIGRLARFRRARWNGSLDRLIIVVGSAVTWKAKLTGTAVPVGSGSTAGGILAPPLRRQLHQRRSGLDRASYQTDTAVSVCSRGAAGDVELHFGQPASRRWVSCDRAPSPRPGPRSRSAREEARGILVPPSGSRECQTRSAWTGRLFRPELRSRSVHEPRPGAVERSSGSRRTVQHQGSGLETSRFPLTSQLSDGSATPILRYRSSGMRAFPASGTPSMGQLAARHRPDRYRGIGHATAIVRTTTCSRDSSAGSSFRRTR